MQCSLELTHKPNRVVFSTVAFLVNKFRLLFFCFYLYFHFYFLSQMILYWVARWITQIVASLSNLQNTNPFNRVIFRSKSHRQHRNSRRHTRGFEHWSRDHVAINVDSPPPQIVRRENYINRWISALITLLLLWVFSFMILFSIKQFCSESVCECVVCICFFLFLCRWCFIAIVPFSMFPLNKLIMCMCIVSARLSVCVCVMDYGVFVFRCDSSKSESNEIK